MNTEQKPEAPATECACRERESAAIKARRIVSAWIDPRPYNLEPEVESELQAAICEALDEFTAPCPCEGLREALAEEIDTSDLNDEVILHLRTQLAAANERAERESRSNALYRGLLDDQHAAYRAIERDLATAQRDLREVVVSSRRALLEITEFSSGWRHGQEGVCLLHIDDLARAQISALAVAKAQGETDAG